MSEYGESKSQDKRLRAQGKPKPISQPMTFENWTRNIWYYTAEANGAARQAWNARQPELDALNARIAELEASKEGKS